VSSARRRSNATCGGPHTHAAALANPARRSDRISCTPPADVNGVGALAQVNQVKQLIGLGGVGVRPGDEVFDLDGPTPSQ
jgi:hypothetical protein